MKDLWTEKYRPKKIDQYVFRDGHQRVQVESWVKDGSIPHLLFSGAAGIGKTTLAKVLFHELGIEEYDILEINASRENNVDTVREKIINFVQMMPFGDMPRRRNLLGAPFACAPIQGLALGDHVTHGPHRLRPSSRRSPHRRRIPGSDP